MISSAARPFACHALQLQLIRCNQDAQFVDQPLQPFISVSALVAHHLNVYCLRCVGQIQQYEGKVRSGPKCKSAR